MPVWGNVNPSTRIELYTGVPFDRNYTNVVRFTNEADQKGYFDNHLTGYYTGSFAPAYNSNTLNGRTGTILYNSYLNPDGSWIRERPRYTVKVNAVAEQLYKCNYMGWTNNPAQQELNPQNFDEDSTCPEQWYYAFITNIYHEANNVSVIEFELDYWQTYHLRITPLQCWVERESPESDEPFEHLEPEEFSPTNYNKRAVQPEIFNPGENQKQVVIVAAMDNEMGTFDGYSVAQAQSGVYCGYLFKTFSSSQKQEITDELLRIASAGASDSVVGVFTTFFPPSDFVSTEGLADITLSQVDTQITREINALDGYQFKNNKLMNYPFRKITATLTNGTQTFVVQPELMNSTTLQISFYRVFNYSGGVIIMPSYYDGMVTDYSKRISYSEKFNGSWTKDQLMNYVSNNAISDTIGILGSTVTTGLLGLVAGNIPGAIAGVVAGAAGGVISAGAKAVQAMQAPDTANPVDSSLPITLMASTSLFTFYDERCVSDEAKTIDSYFHAFGYNCSKTKIPNLTHGHWSYVKTSNFMCNSDGVSGNGLSAITDMFNNGVRVWNYRGTNGKDFDNNYFCKYSDAEGNLIDRQPEVVYN